MDFIKFFFLTLAIFLLTTTTSAQFQSRRKSSANSNLYAQLLSSLQANNDYEEVQKAVEDFNFNVNGIDYSSNSDDDETFKRHSSRETRNLCSIKGGIVNLNEADPDNEYLLPTYKNFTCANTSRRPHKSTRPEKCHGVGILNTVCANVERQELYLVRPRNSNKPWDYNVRTIFDCHCMYVEW